MGASIPILTGGDREIQATVKGAEKHHQPWCPLGCIPHASACWETAWGVPGGL